MSTSTSYTASGDARVRAWLEVRAPLERQLEPLGQSAMAALSLSRGERVLDIGSGIGGTPLGLAAAVGPAGRVAALDVLQAALDVLAGDEALPTQVRLLCGDAQTFPFEPGAFDAAFSRFGVMFFADPLAAFANVRRALRPGGRLAFVCWRGLEENELDALPLRAAAPHLPAHLAAEAGVGGPFSFSDPEAIRATLGGAGFQDIEIRPHDTMVYCGDLQATVAVCSRVGALGAILRGRPELCAAAAPALEAALRARDGPQGPGLRAATWVVSATAGG